MTATVELTAAPTDVGAEVYDENPLTCCWLAVGH